MSDLLLRERTAQLVHSKGGEQKNFRADQRADVEFIFLLLKQEKTSLMQRRKAERGSSVLSGADASRYAATSPRINQLGLVALLRRLPEKYELRGAARQDTEAVRQEDFLFGLSK
ncbi:hypothetical protein GBF38_021280 [Nibea albiflora]|uniref:Uncharacterized protein n=1 Tax=Nibea albiflora TaxID=240163 RepID=A0ACB7FGV2_NIBAL|nr:hypothetical protein GBF38_021280 [Nibea albiflora]